MLLRGFFLYWKTRQLQNVSTVSGLFFFFFLISDFELQSDLPIADRHPQTDGIERGG